MSEYRPLLERARAMFPPLDLDIDDVYNRRDRRRRNQRLAAGAVGVIVALATGIFLVNSLTSDRVPAEPGPTNEWAPLEVGEVLRLMDGNLVAQDPNTTYVRTIVDARVPGERPERITGAAWSFDRGWVAFRAGGLWVIDTSGGAPRQLTLDQGWFPWAWSPTENQLAFVYGDPGDPYDADNVTLIDVETGRETDLGTVFGLLDVDGYPVSQLVWSPDGSRIAYDGASVVATGTGERGSVYSINVESGEHTMLVRQPAGTGEITDIDWSPDSAHLAITYADASYMASDQAELNPMAHEAKVLYVADADGSDLRLVGHIFTDDWGTWNPSEGAGTAWSPDGTRLGYTSFSGPDHRELQVWTFSVKSSASSLVASSCCASGAWAPVWSPDGSQIALETQDYRFLVVKADGSDDERKISELIYRGLAGGSFFCRCYG